MATGENTFKTILILTKEIPQVIITPVNNMYANSFFFWNLFSMLIQEHWGLSLLQMVASPLVILFFSYLSILKSLGFSSLNSFTVVILSFIFLSHLKIQVIVHLIKRWKDSVLEYRKGEVLEEICLPCAILPSSKCLRKERTRLYSYQ